MKPIKCLGIGCSPRKGGNTSILLERALEGARLEGAETEIIYLRDYKFSPCIACDRCRKDGQCVIIDDMQLIYSKLLEADRIVLAAPIFSMGINAQAKALIDRAQRFWSTIYVLDEPVIINKEKRQTRKGIFISTAGTNLKEVFSGAQRCVRYYFRMLDIEYFDELLFPLIDEVGAIIEHENYMDKAFQTGKKLTKI